MNPSPVNSIEGFIGHEAGSDGLSLPSDSRRLKAGQARKKWQSAPRFLPENSQLRRFHVPEGFSYHSGAQISRTAQAAIRENLGRLYLENVFNQLRKGRPT